jgi:hypothetical protein
LDLCDQGGIGEWLPDQFSAGVEPPLMNDGVSRVAGCEEHQATPTGLIGELPPIQPAGKSDIGEQETDVFLRLEQFQRGYPI